MNLQPNFRLSLGFDLANALTEKRYPLECWECDHNWLSDGDDRECPECGCTFIGVAKNVEGYLTVYEERPE